MTVQEVIVRRILLLISVLALFGYAAPAAALCRDDVASLQARVKNEPDRAKRDAAKGTLAKAEIEAKAGSESQCRNFVVRTHRILNGTQPLPPPPGTKLDARGNPITKQRE